MKITRNNNEIYAIDAKAIDAEYDENYDCDAIIPPIAIICINGPLVHKVDPCFDSYDAIEIRIATALMNESVKAVILKIDSPGGYADGAFECHKTIRLLSETYKKPIYAWVDEMACSAAYSIASACTEIWGPESCNVGSIGVIMTLVDRTQNNADAGLKVELITSGEKKGYGSPDMELTPEIISEFQNRVDKLANLFFELVGNARGLTAKEVKGYEAGVYLGKDGLAVKLIDGVDTFENFYELIYMNVISDNKETIITEENSAMAKTNLQLVQEMQNLKSQIRAAKTDEERATLLAQQKELLAQFVPEKKDVSENKESSESADHAESKVTKMTRKLEISKKTVEKLEEDDDEAEIKPEEKKLESEDSEDDSEETEEAKSEDDDSEDNEDDEDDEDDEDNDEDNDEDEEASSKLLKTVAKLTGQKSIQAMIGALASMNEKISNYKSLESSNSKLELELNTIKANTMVEKAVKEGKVIPANANTIAKKGAANIEWLNGYLSEAKQLVNKEPIKENVENIETFSMNDFTPDQLNMIKISAMSSGKTVEQVAKELKTKIAEKNINIKRY